MTRREEQRVITHTHRKEQEIFPVMVTNGSNDSWVGSTSHFVTRAKLQKLSDEAATTTKGTHKSWYQGMTLHMSYGFSSEQFLCEFSMGISVMPS
ncbi:hypothetical protein HAX54_042008, partial [Datura stramonium]|nr:hypothetical protein [Datura stramonium]